MIPGSANPLLLKSAAAAAGGLQIARSLRFNSSDSGYCARTFGTSPTSGTTQTVALWVKRSVLGTLQEMFTGYNGSSPESTGIGFLATSDCLRFSFGGASPYYYLTTTQVFRDASAWYHITLSIDTTQATPSNRVKIYVNEIQVTSFSTADYPAQNAISQFALANSNNKIGTTWNHTINFFNGYLTNIHFIDGQALTPSSFTETDATTGQLIPKAYSGSYGTNGFYLQFADNSSNTASTLGKDTSGNSNNWTPNNLSVTAGVGNDSLVDSPTNYGTDTAVGGEVRGNYATLNPLLPTLTPTNGNLDTPNSFGQNYSTIAVATGKWYVETTVGPITAGTACGLGLHFNPSAEAGAGFYTSGAYIALLYENNLARYEGANSAVNFYPTAGAGSILAIKIDLDSGTQTISYYVNNVLITSSNLPAGKTWFITTRQNNNQSLNFGQRAFAYTAPSGFKALCTQNLPEGTITTSGTYTGNGVADGPFVYLNGVPTAMTVGVNAVTFGTDADKLSNGFKLRTTNILYNQNALSYSYSITTTGAKFKYARAQPNP